LWRAGRSKQADELADKFPRIAGSNMQSHMSDAQNGDCDLSRRNGCS
jgi:hypothetical protein